MTLTSLNNTSATGMTVNSSVELDIDAVGIDRLPFFTRTSVNGSSMAHSFHATRAEAEQSADRMHKTYLKVHAR